MLFSEQIHQAALLLAAARRDGTRLTELPLELRPASLPEAYAIQYEISRQMGTVGGWKVGPPKTAADPRVTPIPARYVLASGSTWPTSEPTRVEVEVALLVGTSLPQRASLYEATEVLRAIRSAHIAFELLGARFIDKTSVSEFTLLADGQSNAALVVGDAIADWTSVDLSTLNLTLRIDSENAARCTEGASFDRMLSAVTWLANHAAEHVGGLQAGQIILTGARIGPTSVPARRRIAAHTDDAATVSATLG
jgi:2-keto-4-pentenoate hydratase